MAEAFRTISPTTLELRVYGQTLYRPDPDGHVVDNPRSTRVADPRWLRGSHPATPRFCHHRPSPRIDDLANRFLSRLKTKCGCRFLSYSTRGQLSEHPCTARNAIWILFGSVARFVRTTKLPRIVMRSR